MFYYNSFGFSICSEIKIPYLSNFWFEEGGKYPNLSIRKEEIIDEEKEALNLINSKISNKRILIKLFGIAIFYIDGQQIIIEPISNKKDIWNDIIFFLIESALPIAVHFNNRVPILASGFTYNKQIYLILGEPCSGKSLINIKLISKGFDFFTDNTAVLALEEGVLKVYSSVCYATIWGEEVSQKNISKKNKVREGIDKHWYYINNVDINTNKLAKIYILWNEKDQVLSNFKKIKLFKEQTLFNELPSKLNNNRKYHEIIFHTCSYIKLELLNTSLSLENKIKTIINDIKTETTFSRGIK